MTKAAYCLDIVTRSFFIFLVTYLLVRQWWLAALITVAINLTYELTIGKKYWQQLAATPKRPRRRFRVVLRDLWQRVFAREHTKGLVWAGIIILLMSWVVRLNTYYIIMACIVFTLAAISRFAPPKKSVTLPHEPANHPSSGPPDSPPPATK